jgi:hypothetical protein
MRQELAHLLADNYDPNTGASVTKTIGDIVTKGTVIAANLMIASGGNITNVHEIKANNASLTNMLVKQNATVKNNLTVNQKLTAATIKAKVIDVDTITGIYDIGANLTGNVTATIVNTDTLSVTGNINGTLSEISNAQPNIKSLGNLVSLVVANTGTISGANSISANYLAGTITTSAQPNIRSVGSLTNLDVDGNLTVEGHLTVNGSTTYVSNIASNAKTILLANTASDEAGAHDSGLIVGSNTAMMIYSNVSDTWEFTKGLTGNGAGLSDVKIHGDQSNGITKLSVDFGANLAELDANTNASDYSNDLANIHGITLANGIYRGDGRGITNIEGAAVNGWVSNATYALRVDTLSKNGNVDHDTMIRLDTTTDGLNTIDSVIVQVANRSNYATGIPNNVMTITDSGITVVGNLIASNLIGPLANGTNSNSNITVTETSVNINGNISISGNASVPSIQTGNVIANNIIALVNATSVGDTSDTGNVFAGRDLIVGTELNIISYSAAYDSGTLYEVTLNTNYSRRLLYDSDTTDYITVIGMSSAISAIDDDTYNVIRSSSDGSITIGVTSSANIASSQTSAPVNAKLTINGRGNIKATGSANIGGNLYVGNSAASINIYQGNVSATGNMIVGNSSGNHVNLYNNGNLAATGNVSANAINIGNANNNVNVSTNGITVSNKIGIADKVVKVDIQNGNITADGYIDGNKGLDPDAANGISGSGIIINRLGGSPAAYNYPGIAGEIIVDGGSNPPKLWVCVDTGNWKSVNLS